MAGLTEEDVKQRFITPAIVETAGWARDQLFMEAFAPGQIIVQGTMTRRGKEKRADYVLRTRTGKPLAVVEAKDGDHTVSDGLQQAMSYAVSLDAPFAYSSNGTGFIEHDFLTGAEREFSMDRFPTEAELWERYTTGLKLSPATADLISQPYFFDQFTGKEPRYYQRVAIDRTLRAISEGQRRLLLVMATGTGKTFTSFQIIWRLLEAGTVKRVLYLADRNYLLDQTIAGDFRPFGNRVTKVQHKMLDSSYEVYLSLYHQLAGEDGEEPFRQFRPEFFDLVVVDECHRGSAKDDSQWRAVLDYFSSAIHLGLTATPKETKDVSNQLYFGEPIYTYTLKEGIEDGFLAPFKVLRVGLNVDLEGWRPTDGMRDDDGNLVEDREYNTKDYDRTLVIDERTKVVAKYISSWLRTYGQDSKTIVFCVDIEHAKRMRQALVNENTEQVLKDYRYVWNITGDDDEGKSQLENFADPDEPYPTIVTTSKLLTTGVDVKTVKLIVLESNISSMTEFKQIIGRGTRLSPEHGKEYFTILDFRGSTRLFADPEFDGDPVVIKEVPTTGSGEDDPDWTDDTDDISDPDPEDNRDTDDVPPAGGGDFPPADDGAGGPTKKVYVRGVATWVLNERVHFIDPKTGKIVTESIMDYSRQHLLDRYATLSEFLDAWSGASRKAELLSELEEDGVFLSQLREEAGQAAEGLDDFDLIVHVAFDKPPLTRHERANKVRKVGYLHKYSAECQAVLEGLLDKYATLGITQIEDIRILSNDPFEQMGRPPKIVEYFGGKDEYLEAVRELVDTIYAA